MMAAVVSSMFNSSRVQ